MKGLMEEQIDICKQYQYIFMSHNLDENAFSMYETIEKTFDSCKKYIPKKKGYGRCMWDRHEKVLQCLDYKVSEIVIAKNEAMKEYNNFIKFHKNLESLE